jgi:hypothetical protein
MCTILFFRCKVYSFSGTTLAKEIKTFSIDNCYSKVAMGPPDLSEILSNALANTILQRTQLTQKLHEGDIQYDITITKFEFSPVATPANSEIGSIQRLTIDVEVNFTNNYDAKSSLKGQKFSQFADASENADVTTEESKLIEEVFEKLTEDIINASAANW